jgi:hypothetical protein
MNCGVAVEFTGVPPQAAIAQKWRALVGSEVALVSDDRSDAVEFFLDEVSGDIELSGISVIGDAGDKFVGG